MKKHLQKSAQLLGSKNFLSSLVLFLIYVASGKIGLIFASVNPSATAIWPPTGLALAAFLLLGRRAAPAIFLGAFIVNLTTAGTIITSLGIALGNTLEGALGAYLVARYAGGIHAFDRTLNVFKFVILAAVVSTTISADIGVLTLIAGKLAAWKDFLTIWVTWWLGDMGGNLVLAPFILSWAVHPRFYIGNYRKAVNLIISFLVLFAVTQIVFKGLVPYAYLCIPIAVWIAFWFGRRGATTSTLFVAAFAIFYTLHMQGPFANAGNINQSLLLLQLFLGIFSITGLTFATVVGEVGKSEKLLATSEARFRALIENSFEGIVLVDATSKILYTSASVQRILGYTPKELVGKNGFDLVAPEFRKITAGKLAELVLKPGSSLTIEYQSIRKDKKLIWVEATGTNLLLEPEVNAIVINFRDITQTRAARQDLLEAKLKDDATLASIGEGVIATDNEGKITVVNQAACDMLGFREKELIGKPLVTIIPIQDEQGNIVPESERPMTNALKYRREIVTPPSTTMYYVRKDKGRFPVQFTLTPIIQNDEIAGTIEVFRDITREKEVDRAKTEFVSIASHQLRTPLAIINWYVERLLKNERPDDEKKEYLNQVYRASGRMVSLINSLLNVSRLELGTFIIEPQEINLIQVIEDVLTDLHPLIEKKNINIQKSFPEKLMVSADSKLLTIIIQNLISNAIKYSKYEGRIQVQLTSNDEDFTIRVSDEGLGIPKNQQSKIFTKMFRADNAQAMDSDGTGLGLYIAKAIVEEAGGKIWFSSLESRGTDFFVSFPTSGMKKKEGLKILR